MAVNQNDGTSKTAGVARLADVSIVASSWLSVVILLGVSAALLEGQAGLRAWSSWRIGFILYVIPWPDLLFGFVSVTWKSTRADYVHVAALHVFAAALMVAAAVGIAKSRRWAYWLYSLICLSAILGRSYAIWKTWEPSRFPVRFPALYFVLNSIGVAVALAAAWYASHRALSPGSRRVTSAAKPGRRSVPIPWAVVTLSIFLVVCVLLRTAFLSDIDHWQVRYESLRLTLMTLAYVSVLALGVVRQMRRFAASAALGVAVMGFITVGGLGMSALPGLALGLALRPTALAITPLTAFTAGGFLLGNLVLAVVALVSAIRGRTLHVGSLALALVFVGSIDPITQALRKYDVNHTAYATELASGVPYILYRTESCLFRYKATRSGDGFPDSLARVDDTLPGCLQSGLAKGRNIGGYRITYAATDAPRGHFSLTAIPSVRTTSGMISFYADETGIVRTLTGDRLAESSDGGVAPAEEFYMIRSCLHDFDRLFGHRNTAASAGNQLAQGHERYPVSFAEMAPPDRCYLRGQLDGDEWKTAAYRFSYRDLAQGGAENFALAARPLQYAVTGLRSYFMDNTFVVHATSEDRDATVNDPVADVCEFLSLVPCGEEQATPGPQR